MQLFLGVGLTTSGAPGAGALRAASPRPAPPAGAVATMLELLLLDHEDSDNIEQGVLEDMIFSIFFAVDAGAGDIL